MEQQQTLQLHSEVDDRPLLAFRPSELIFPFDLYCGHSVSVCLTNLTHEPVAWKIKTNRKDRYFISPFEGLLDPYSECECVIVMEPQSEYPDILVDKFLIQSVVSSEPGVNVRDLWYSLQETYSRGVNCFQKYIVNCRLEIVQRFRKIKNTTLGEAKRRPRRKKVKKVKRKRRAYTADLSGEHPLPPPFFKSFSDQQLPRKLVAVQEEPGATTPPPFRPRSFSFNDPNDFTSEEISPRSVDSFDNRKYDVDGVKRYLAHAQLSNVNIEEKLSFLRKQGVADGVIMTALKKHLQEESST